MNYSYVWAANGAVATIYAMFTAFNNDLAMTVWLCAIMIMAGMNIRG
jgi:multidrug transporter EmrE-like cation transporter